MTMSARLALVLAAAPLAACAGQTVISNAQVEEYYEPQMLAYPASRGGMYTEVTGNPFQTEKAVLEAGENLPEELRQEIDGNLAAVREAMQEEDAEVLETRTNELHASAQRIGEFLYTQVEEPDIDGSEGEEEAADQETEEDAHEPEPTAEGDTDAEESGDDNGESDDDVAEGEFRQTE